MRFISTLLLTVCLSFSALAMSPAPAETKPISVVQTAAAEKPVAAKSNPLELRTFGSETAPVTLYLFTSFSCPHCSAFHAKVMPELKKEFLNSGSAKLVLVDMPYDARAMTGTLIARCMPSKSYDKFSDTVYDNQRVWGSDTNPRAIITGYAKLAGMGDDEINACLADKELQKMVMSQRDNLANLYGVKGMPTLVAVKGASKKTLVGADKDVIVKEIKQFMGK